MPKVSHLETL